MPGERTGQANGKLDDVSPERKAFLDYLKGETTENQRAKGAKDPYIQELEEAVRKAKRNREWRREYMMLWMRDQENIERGVEQGMKEGIKKGVKQGEQQARCSIITRMLIQGFSDEQIKRVCDTSDEEIEECRKRADAVG